MTRKEAAAATREKIVTAASALFGVKSYEDVTMRDLARNAGLSTGAIFAHFKDKADLWRGAMGTEPPVDSPQLRALLAEGYALIERLTEFHEHITDDAVFREFDGHVAPVLARFRDAYTVKPRTEGATA